MAVRIIILAVSAWVLSACASDGGSSGPRCNPMNPSACAAGGAGGSSGTGGGAGTIGTGGTGATPPPQCVTSALCRACPGSVSECASDSDCGAGFACISSGCTTTEGAPIQYCAFLPAGTCETQADCDEGSVCTDIGEANRRCVKSESGCANDSECLRGFFCEGGACVDRRVPCFLDEDCPMNFICEGTVEQRFCERIHRDCEIELDCEGVAPRCVNIDGDLDDQLECAAAFDPNAEGGATACDNSQCTDSARPVCEVGGDSRSAVCGQYGLCLDDDDCAEGFACALLWSDGRRECVIQGDCTSMTDCPERQVCATSRSGAPQRAAACQAGVPSP